MKEILSWNKKRIPIPLSDGDKLVFECPYCNDYTFKELDHCPKCNKKIKIENDK